MTEIYLLDDLNASMHFHAGAKVISADPKASAKLQARNIRYSILEDYYDEKSLWQNEKIFFDSQIDWFNSLDDFFISRISFCEKNRIKLATVNYLRIKYFVDMTIIYSKMLSGLIGSLPKNSHLKYVYNHEESIEFSIFKFVPQNRMHFRSILVEICKLNNIQLSCISLSPSLNCLPVVGRLSEQKSPRLKLLLRSIRNYFLYKKYKRLFKTTALPLQNYKACFLHAGSIDIDIPLKAFLRDGGMTYVQSGKTIYQESAFFSCPVFFLSGSVHYEVQSQLTQASFFLTKKTILLSGYRSIVGLMFS